LNIKIFKIYSDIKIIRVRIDLALAFTVPAL